MSGERALPEQASLRYLKLEAKRRVAAGEFPALHQAQLAIAREHRQPSWAALRSAVAARDPVGGEGHALAQLRWIISRFSGASEPGWAAPDSAELAEHFTDGFLAEFAPDRVAGFIARMGAELTAELSIDLDLPFDVRGRLAGRLVVASSERRPPYRLTGVRLLGLGERISDPRAASPPTTASGAVPGPVPAHAAASVSRLGLVGLVLAGGTRDADRPAANRTGTSRAGTGPSVAQPAGENPDGESWTTAIGWADLERAEPLGTDHAFPVFEITMVVTAIAVLRLAASGRLRIDDPANRYLASVRLADDTVTVRDLLARTGGVAVDPSVLFGPVVRTLADVAGTVLECSGRRGVVGPGLAGYAALGELISGLTGEPYPAAAARLVLEPLGMRGSWFPDRWPAAAAAGHGPAVTGYEVTTDGAFAPLDGLVCVFPAAGGLWTTAADLVRLGLGWPALLPRSLAAQAVRPHAPMPSGAHSGLGWIVNERAGVAGHPGGGPGAAGSLLISLDASHAAAAVANRLIPIEPVNAGVLQAIGGLSVSVATGSA